MLESTTPSEAALASPTGVSRRTVLRRAAYVTPTVIALGLVPRGSAFAGSGVGSPSGGITSNNSSANHPPKKVLKVSPKKSSVPTIKAKPKTGIAKVAKTAKITKKAVVNLKSVKLK